MIVYNCRKNQKSKKSKFGGASNKLSPNFRKIIKKLRENENVIINNVFINSLTEEQKKEIIEILKKKEENLWVSMSPEEKEESVLKKVLKRNTKKKPENLLSVLKNHKEKNINGKNSKRRKKKNTSFSASQEMEYNFSGLNEININLLRN